MTRETNQTEQQKQALKEVRAKRAGFIKKAAAASKRQRAELNKIKDGLAEGPATPVELAQATGLEARRVTWLLAAMRKYGQVVEADKQGDYFSYRLNPDRKDQ